MSVFRSAGGGLAAMTALASVVRPAPLRSASVTAQERSCADETRSARSRAAAASGARPASEGRLERGLLPAADGSGRAGTAVRRRRCSGGGGSARTYAPASAEIASRGSKGAGEGSRIRP